MDQLPALTGIFFVLTAILTVMIFHGATYFSKTVLQVLVYWLLFQAVVSLSGFYHVTDFTLPQLCLQIGPVFLFIILLFSTAKGRFFIDHLDLPTLTVLHVIRIPVELVLFWLFFHDKTTTINIFEIRNLDLLSGISAPVMMYLVFIENRLNKRALLIWNFISLGLLLNVVAIAVFTAPLPFSYVDIHQSNVAVLYFPFVWMSCCIIPLLLLSHLSAIRQLLQVENIHPTLA